MLIAAIKNIVKIFDNTIYDTFIKAAEKCGLDCVLLENTKELLEIVSRVDLITVFGGDGTTLMTAEIAATRSEERRVGKECRSRWSPYH